MDQMWGESGRTTTLPTQAQSGEVFGGGERALPAMARLLRLAGFALGGQRRRRLARLR